MQRRPWAVWSPRSPSSRRKAAQTVSFSVAVWTKPRRTFSPCRVIPRARIMLSSAKVFPSKTKATMSCVSSRRSRKARSFRALARMNRRDSLDGLRPKVAGRASAQAW